MENSALYPRARIRRSALALLTSASSCVIWVWDQGMPLGLTTRKVDMWSVYLKFDLGAVAEAFGHTICQQPADNRQGVVIQLEEHANVLEVGC